MIDMEEIIIGEFQISGVNKINIDLLEKKWNHLFFLAEWRGGNQNWRLVKYLRKDSATTCFKSNISEDQAREVIARLNLVSENVTFRKAFSWRRLSDIYMLRDYRRRKSNNLIAQSSAEIAAKFCQI